MPLPAAAVSWRESRAREALARVMTARDGPSIQLRRVAIIHGRTHSALTAHSHCTNSRQAVMWAVPIPRVPAIEATNVRADELHHPYRQSFEA